MDFRALREAAGFKRQAALAAAVDMTRANISQIELGRIDPEKMNYKTVTLLASVLGVTPAVLVRVLKDQRRLQTVA